MSHTTPTVKVRTDSPDNEEGFYLINQSDFDPEVHELYEELTDKKPQPAVVEIPPVITEQQPVVAEPKKAGNKK